VPNTRVRFSAAFIGGVIAGTLWYLNNVFAFFYVSRVITNSEIYGKLGLVPVFMLGLYLCWVILLFGAQVAYAWQNRAAYLQDKIADNVNQRGREFVALRIMTLLGQRFQNGFPPMPVIELSAELGVPSRLTQRILRILAAAHLVTEVAGDENAYLPARPLDTINAHHILSALRTGSGRELLMDSAPALAGIFGDFARIEAAERTASEKISVLALVQHLPAQFKLETPKGMVQTETKSTPEAKFETQISKIEPVELTPTMAANAEAEAVKEISVEKKAAHRETVKPNEMEFPL
jgi:membrane protein